MSIYSRKLLRTFCAVVENGGFSGAQQTLGISQPAISTHIRNLETVLGYSLCRRGRSGFFLTERGQAAYEKCRAILNSVDDFESDMLELRGSLKGTLRMGLVDTVLTNEDLPISRAIGSFYKQENEVKIELKVASPAELEVNLINGTIDLAVAPFWQRLDGLIYKHILSEQHKLYCGHGHPLFDADPSSITADVMDLYRTSNRSYKKASGNQLTDVRESAALIANMEAQTIMIMSGQFIGTLPEHFAQHWQERGLIRVLEHPKLVWHSPFYLATRRTPTQRFAVSNFMEHFQKCME